MLEDSGEDIDLAVQRGGSDIGGKDAKVMVPGTTASSIR